MMLVKLECVDGPCETKKVEIEFGVSKGRDLFPLNHSFLVKQNWKGSTYEHPYVVSIEDYGTDKERLVLRYDEHKINDIFYVSAG